MGCWLLAVGCWYAKYELLLEFSELLLQYISQ